LKRKLLGDTYATTLMIAERGADLIRGVPQPQDAA